MTPIYDGAFLLASHPSIIRLNPPESRPSWPRPGSAADR